MSGVPAWLDVVTIGVSNLDRCEQFYLTLRRPREVAFNPNLRIDADGQVMIP